MTSHCAIIAQATFNARSEAPKTSILGVSGAFRNVTTINHAFDVREIASGDGGIGGIAPARKISSIPSRYNHWHGLTGNESSANGKRYDYP